MTTLQNRLAGACATAALTLVVSAWGTAAVQPAPPEHRFEAQVRAYEAADHTTPPPDRPILLVGDSQFYRWKTLDADLPGYTIVNRGIDAFQMSDLLYYADRLVIRYSPRLVVLHAGGNDVHNGRRPEDVLADFKAFVARVRSRFPAVPIVFSSLTPGPGRWEEAPQRVRTNDMVKAYVATQSGLQFIDLWHAMLTPDGKPRDDLWVDDRIHPNHAGYLIRVELMRPLLGPPDKH